jgi:hypothetical protein
MLYIPMQRGSRFLQLGFTVRSGSFRFLDLFTGFTFLLGRRFYYLKKEKGKQKRENSVREELFETQSRASSCLADRSYLLLS